MSSAPSVFHDNLQVSQVPRKRLQPPPCIAIEESVWLANSIEARHAIYRTRTESETNRVAGLIGFKSQCYFPFLGRAWGLGVLALASVREPAFSHPENCLLQQVTSHVAIAVENADKNSGE